MSPEENKAVVRRWYAETDKGTSNIVDELCAQDYVDHGPPRPGMPEGSAGVRRANELLRAAFPDTVHTTEDQIAEGDKVVTRLRARATFRGEIWASHPTAKSWRSAASRSTALRAARCRALGAGRPAQLHEAVGCDSGA